MYLVKLNVLSSTICCTTLLSDNIERVGWATYTVCSLIGYERSLLLDCLLKWLLMIQHICRLEIDEKVFFVELFSTCFSMLNVFSKFKVWSSDQRTTFNDCNFYIKEGINQLGSSTFQVKRHGTPSICPLNLTLRIFSVIFVTSLG